MKEILNNVLDGADVREIVLERLATNTVMVSTGGGLRRHHKKENARMKTYLNKVFSGSGKPRRVTRTAGEK
jgi:hypothetical protein